MQRLEVSGAVRPLYGTLGVKGLKFPPATLRYLFSLSQTYTQLYADNAQQNTTLLTGTHKTQLNFNPTGFCTTTDSFSDQHHRKHYQGHSHASRSNTVT